MLEALAEEGDIPLLPTMVALSEQTLCALTGRQYVPPGMAGLLTRLTLIALNQRGMEGETMRREGSVQLAVEGLPSALQKEIAAWRLAAIL